MVGVPKTCTGTRAIVLPSSTAELLRKETSLASFTAGFKLPWGLSKKLETDGLYSFDDDIGTV